MNLFRRCGLGKRVPMAVTAIAMATALSAALAVGDTLELRNGQVIQGKFLDGSPLNIHFQVDGKIQTFATKDVLDIGFSESDSGANAAPAAAPAAQPAPNPAASTTAVTTAAPANSQPTAAASTSKAPSEAAAPAHTQTAQTTATATRDVVIPAGTSLMVRMIDSVDSSTNKVGDPFKASLDAPLVIGDTVVAPKGADVYGKLAQAQQSGQFAGNAQLTLELTGIRVNGQTVPINSTNYDVAGSSRGKQSAERIGGGAVLGALIGAIAGGGKGAAVGAAVGGGAGTAAQVLTKGPQVRVPSETLLEFKTQQPVTVQVPK
jgi:hypothetical protein